MLSLWQEVGQNASVELLLANLTSSQQLLSSGVECALEESEESQRFSVNDLSMFRAKRSVDGHALEDDLGGGRVDRHVGE